MGETGWRRAALAVLFRPGAEGPPRSAWPEAWARLEAASGREEAARAFRARGWIEAARLLESGSAPEGDLLCACDPDWPAGWRRSGLPPVLHLAGALPPGPWLGVVGSRRISGPDESWARALAAACGASILTGGAPGADRAGARGGLEAGLGAVEVLPCGLGFPFGTPGAVRLSASPPEAGFEARAAMERNAMIYAGARLTVVVRARLGRGGTWNGAAEALRRGRRIAVQDDPADEAAEALIRLGAIPVRTPEEAARLFREPPTEAQPPLFIDGEAG